MNLSHLKHHSGLLLVLFLHFAIAGYANLRIPLSVGPDEVAHFMFARFLKREGYLPLTPDDREAAGYKSDQPPLYAALVAITFLGDINTPPFVKIANGVPRRHLVNDGVVDRLGVNRSWDVVHTEAAPSGEFLFWHYGRLLSTIFSDITLIIIYLVTLKTFENRPRRNLWALAATAIVAFIPTFIFISAVFSYESLLGLWLALYLLVAVPLLKGARSKWLFFLAGCFVGLAIVTKLSALPTPLSLALLILIVGYRAGWAKHVYLTRSALSLSGLLVGAGWWFAFIELNLNQVEELGWITGLLNPILVGDGSGEGTSATFVNALASRSFEGVVSASPSQIIEWVESIFATFWFGQRGQVFVSLVIVSVLGGMGLKKVWRQNPQNRSLLLFLCFNIGLFLILPFGRLVISGKTGVAAQGHHVLFPTAGAVAILITWGLSAWIPASTGKQWIGGLSLGAGLLLWVTILTIGYQPPVPLPVRTIPPMMPSSASQVELDFGPMVLKGYELTGLTGDGFCCASTRPALGVNLYWVAEEFAPEDYVTTVTLVDDQGQAQSIWMGHGANGRYPTRAWEPGDIIREELYLPLIGLQPGIYAVNLEVKGAHSALTTADGNSTFTLTQVRLSKPLPLPHRNQEFAVWQMGQVINDRLVFNERSTIQITASPDLELKLIGPDQAERSPDKVAGHTRIFIVDPLWPKGDYRLCLASDGNQSEWQAASTLTVQGFKRQIRIPDSQIIVKANFANQIILLGYNLPRRHLMAGESLPLTLHWQALQTMPTDFIMFTRLRDQAGNVWGGYDRWPQDAYSPFLWAAGEVVEDGFTLKISPDAPDGLYYLDVGFYLPVGEAAVSLPLVQEGRMSEVTSVSIGPFKIGDTLPAGVTFDLPTPQVPLNQLFGDGPNLTLLGYDLARQTLQIGQDQQNKTFELTLYWRSESPLSIDYTTFVQVLNSKNEIVAQKDQLPTNGDYPTSLWQPGEIITDEIVVSLPANLPADNYRLVVGLYDSNTGTRLTVPGHQENSLTLIEKEITQS